MSSVTLKLGAPATIGRQQWHTRETCQCHTAPRCLASFLREQICAAMRALSHTIIVVVCCEREADRTFISSCFIQAAHDLIVLTIFVVFGAVGCELHAFHEMISSSREFMLQLVPARDWPDDAIGSKRDCWDGNVGKVRAHDASGTKCKPVGVDVQAVSVSAVFGPVAERLACLALSIWCYCDLLALLRRYTECIVHK